MPPKAKGAGKKKNGYQMPEKFEDGFSLKDIFKTTWTLGKPIGQGGFGLIYLASKGESKIKNSDQAEYVIKIEPKDNGPLFCETHFYVNCTKEDELKSFMKAYNLKHLAMPRYISSGICSYNGKDYRFLVMDRYVKDLQSVLNDSKTHQINEIGVLCLMRQILYSLEYIHKKGYTHGDIKGANLMLKSDSESYLVDYGLACRFQRDNVHAKYEIKPERRHNGTIEYTSRDAHCGAQTYRRSDLEILGYCVVHWLSGTLPWINLIANCEQVQQSKIKNMNNCKEFVKTTLKNCSEQVKSFIEYFMTEVNKLEYDSEPPYSKIHQKLTETLGLIGYSQNTVDNFAIFKPASITKTPKATNAKNILKEDDNEMNGSAKKTPRSYKRVNKLNENEEQNDESNSETPAKLKTLSSKKTPASKSKNNICNLIDELSDIDDDDDQSYPVKNNARSAKKARINLQSTAIDQTDIEHFQTNLKKIIEDEKKNKTQSASNKNLNPIQIIQNELNNRKNNNGVVIGSPKVVTIKENSEEKATISPRHSTRNKIKNAAKYEDVEEHDIEDEEFHNHKKVNQKQQNDHYHHSNNKQPEYLTQDLVNTPSKYAFRTPSRSTKSPQISQQISAQKDTQLNKIKQQESVAPLSPLALSNLDKQSGITLMKKRKNVPKATVATQTENSYLQTHQPFFKN